MKKILVVLLVLAVAGGVFAQDWSLGGKAEMGAYVNFDGKDADGEPAITVIASQYNQPYDWWDFVHGNFGMSYTRDTLRVGLDWSTHNYRDLEGWVEYGGENYALKISSGLGNLDGFWPQTLWGYYKILNGMVHLETAVSSRDTQWWVSDTTGAFGNDHGWKNLVNPVLDGAWGGGRNSFSKYAEEDIFLVNLALNGLEFGVQLRDLFELGGYLDDQFPGHIEGTNPWNAGYKGRLLIDDVLKNLLFGLKFQMAPFEIAVQFLMKDYGAYFGGKIDLNPVTVGLSFMGILNNEDVTQMRVGANVGYGADWGGLGLNGLYGLESFKASTEVATQIGVEPYFWYNVIPTHLQFKTDIGFYFNGGTGADGQPVKLETTWAVQPQLFWNFLGTGAGGYWNWGTGMIFRYRLVSDVESGRMSGAKTNALDMTFRYAY